MYIDKHKNFHLLNIDGVDNSTRCNIVLLQETSDLSIYKKCDKAYLSSFHLYILYNRRSTLHYISIGTLWSASA